MTPVATGTLQTEAKVQYLCIIFHGEAFRKFELLSNDAKNTETPLYVDYLLKVSAWYFPPINTLSKQKREMRRCMKNPRSLKVKRYSACLIDLNEYLVSFPGATMAEKWT